MSGYNNDYIQFLLGKSREVYFDAILLFEQGRYISVVSRLYYSCFYAVSALNLKNGHESKTHSGQKTLLNLHFVKTAIISEELGKFYSNLFTSKLEGDYGDFINFNKETVEELQSNAIVFIDTIESLINS